MTKEGMVNDLAELIADKLYPGEGTVERQESLDKIRDQIKYLEEDVFEQCIELVKSIDIPCSYLELFQELGKAGLLKIKPKIIHDVHDIPSLHVRHDKFLHWFRGYGFQISDTPTGIGDRGSSGTAMRFDLEAVKTLPKIFGHLVALSHIMQAGTRYDIWNATLATNTELLDEFMRLTAEETDLPTEDFSTAEILKSVKLEQSLTRGELHKLLLCETPSMAERGKDIDYNKVFGSISLGESHVALKQFKDTEWKVIEFPAWYPENQVNWYSYDLPDKGTYLRTMWERLTWLLLGFDSIVLQMFYVFPVTKRGKVSVNLGDLETRGTTAIKNTGDLWNFMDEQKILLNEAQSPKQGGTK